jgi:4-amino-4-deoxy-L-arabinose transferase-like glycosyltransferase
VNFWCLLERLLLPAYKDTIVLWLALCVFAPASMPWSVLFWCQIQIQIQINLLFLKNITFLSSLSEEITINCNVSAVHKDWRKEGEDTQDLS